MPPRDLAGRSRAVALALPWLHAPGQVGRYFRRELCCAGDLASAFRTAIGI